MTWIMTATGRRIDFINPDPLQISIDDVIVSLSRNHRFGGFSPFKIGQHIIEVVELMVRKALEENPNLTEAQIAEIVLVGLLHDFPEYVVGDCPTPFKRLLAPLFDNAESAILLAMLGKWQAGAAYAKHGTLLKWADNEAVQQEAVRFRLDGFFVDDNGEERVVPRVWVPEDKVVTLASDILTEEAVAMFLLMYFLKAMVLSGRVNFIGGYAQNFLHKEAKHSNKTVEEWVREHRVTLTLESIFLDGWKAYI